MGFERSDEQIFVFAHYADADTGIDPVSDVPVEVSLYGGWSFADGR